jgi:trypsin
MHSSHIGPSMRIQRMSRVRGSRTRREGITIINNYSILLRLVYTIILVLCYTVPGVTGRIRLPKDEENRIVGGADAPQDRFPTIALLSDKYGNFVCAGSLILPNVVLSAAHCTNYVDIAQLGVYNRLLASFTSTKVETFTIVEKKIHPKYVTTKSDCDFVLLKLSGSSKSITPITLNDNPDIPAAGSTVTAIGWGATSEGGSTSYNLREVNLSAVSYNQCLLVYGPTVTENMLCAGGPGKDACQGDSGGPLYVTGKSSTEDVLAGVVSW